jgi:hypothetical protein
MTADLDSLADSCAFLNFDGSPDLRVISSLATIEVGDFIA